MVEMLEALNCPLEGRHHSGLDDCRNIATIVVELVRRYGPTVMQVTTELTKKQRRKLGLSV